MATILVADDHENTRITLEAILSNEGHSVTLVHSGQAALEQVQHNEFDIVITDLRLGDIDGIKVLSFIRELSPRAKVVIMTAFGSISSTVRAMKLGAYDYLTKPVHKSNIINVVNRILSDSSRAVRKEPSSNVSSERERPAEIIGEHPSMLEVIKTIQEVARVDVPVLILGESGTGKELAARYIHRLSLRYNQPFVAVNCATLPDNLQDSELFGHVKGAYTGAVDKKTGLFEQANNGTILLDEIGEMTLGTQAKLLRVLEDGEVRRIGGSGVFHVNTRVLASTNVDLTRMIKAGKFREDLFFRLNVIQVALPPLRKRMSDLPLLIDYFIKKYVEMYQRNIKAISQDARKQLEWYEWPGNIRELENTLKRAVILCRTDTIEKGDLGLSEFMPSQEDSTSSIADFQKSLILQTLEETKWNTSMTALKLGISPTTLWRKMKKYGLNKKTDGAKSGDLDFPIA